MIYQIMTHRMGVCAEAIEPNSEDGWLLLERLFAKQEADFLRGSATVWIDMLAQDHPTANPALLGMTAGSITVATYSPTTPEQSQKIAMLRKQSWCFHLALSTGAPLPLLNVVDDQWMHNLLTQYGYSRGRANTEILGHSTDCDCDRWSLFDDRGQLLTKFDLVDRAKPEQRARLYLSVLQTLASQERVPWPLFAATVLPDDGPWHR